MFLIISEIYLFLFRTHVNIDKHCEELINSNTDKLSLFTEKANEAQSRLVNHVFANSVAFSEEIITSVTE